MQSVIHKLLEGRNLVWIWRCRQLIPDANTTVFIGGCHRTLFIKQILLGAKETMDGAMLLRSIKLCHKTKGFEAIHVLSLVVEPFGGLRQEANHYYQEYSIHTSAVNDNGHPALGDIHEVKREKENGEAFNGGPKGADNWLVFLWVKLGEVGVPGGLPS